jgi:transposase
LLNYEKQRGVIMTKRADKAFQEEAVRLALSSPQPYAKTARDLGIKESSLYTWIAKHKESSPQSQENQPTHTELLQEIRTLKGEVSRLKEERDILKKAAKFFANEHP